MNTHLYFPQDLYAQLETLSQAQNQSLAQVVRDLVSEGVKKRKSGKKNRQEKSPGVSFLDRLVSSAVKAPAGTPKNVSSSHDKYLYD